MRSVRALAILLLLLLAWGDAKAAAAWSPRTQLAMLDQAASIAPPDLRRQLGRHMKEMKRGLLSPFGPDEARNHISNPDGSGLLASLVEAEVERAVEAIRSHRPFAEIVFQLGVVSHFVADANNPLLTADSDPREIDYFNDYLRYVESIHDRFPVVFYGKGRRLDTPRDLTTMVAASFRRARGLYPFVGLEYTRVGRIDGISQFDDRSTAFGVGSLSFSHGVSDMAAVLRYIWIRAGGMDPRNLPLSSVGYTPSPDFTRP